MKKILSLALAGGVALLGANLGSPPAQAATPSYSISTDTGYSLTDASTDTGVHCGYGACGTTVAAPFSLQAYGGSYSRAYVSSNGTIQFGSTVTDQTANTSLPSGAFTGPTMLPYWGGDHYTGSSGDSYGIFTRTLGVSPNRQFVIEWKIYDDNAGDGYSFEQAFKENSGIVTTTYGATGADGGQFATVGAQNGSIASQYEADQQGALFSGLRITYNPTTVTTVPSAPTDPSAQVQNANQSTLFWGTPDSDGGSPITGYQVHRDGASTAGGNGYTSKILSPDVHSYTFGKLLPGTTYTLHVIAYNAVGSSAYAETTVTQPAGPPVAPAIGTASPGSKRGGPINATARWSAPTSTGGSAITGYRVYAYRVASGSIVQQATSNVLPPVARDFTMILPKAGQWEFRVVAINGVGTSPLSGYSNVVTAR